METNGVKKYERAYDFSASVTQVLIVEPMDRIIIDGGFIDVPSNITVTLEFAYSDGIFGTPVTGVTNQKYPLDNLQVQQIKVTKTGGAGTRIWAAFSQGTGGAVITVGGNVSVVNTPPLVTYNSTPLVKANGETGTLQGDSALRVFMREAFAPKYENNPLSVAQMLLLPTAAPDGSWTPFKNLGANATLNVKASGGNIQSLYCRSRSAAIAYLQLFITATVPSGGAVPDFSFMIPIGGSIMIGNDFFGLGGAWGSLGWAFGFSSTENTYTAGTAADHSTWILIK